MNHEHPASSGRFGLRAHLVILALAMATLAAPFASAQTPPLWNGGSPTNVNNATSACGTPGCAIPPAPWPTECGDNCGTAAAPAGSWIPYSWGTTYPDQTLAEKNPISDPRVQDPSNGGTSPQNYVNVSSGCSDKSKPSIYYYFNPVTQTIYFRWRVEQIANSYGTGPSAGAYSSSDPWKSALWTVFFDLDGDGFRDFAAHLDGSSGSPSAPVDILRSIWSGTKTNSIDYVTAGTNIFSLFTNPTGFVNNSTSQVMQFATSGGTATPTVVQWPNGSSEVVWDYGTTRSTNITSGSCVEYLVDYQIPVAMLNASAVSGKTFTNDTPFQFLFATANSLNNPFQKDIVWEGSFVCDATAPGPFGDALTLNLGIIPQPISTAITAGAPNSCTVPVTAQIMSALTVNNCDTTSMLVNAQFKYWYDTNGNGLPDEAAGAWINIGDATTPVGTTVTANWNLTNLIQGQYLIALEITDNRGHTTRTWENNAGLTNQPIATGPTGGTYSNAPTAGLSSATHGINYQKVTIGGACGAPPPAVTKTASPSNVSAGGLVTYTLTINNTSGTQVTVASVVDTLPAGFTYAALNAGLTTLGTPTATNASGSNVTWTFNNVIVPGGASRTLVFTANAGASGGRFYNTATFATNVGNLTATDNTGVTVTTANLIVTKMAALTSADTVPVTLVNRGDSVTFTMVVTNNSGTNVTGGRVTDTLPPGFTYVSATPAPSCSPAGPVCADPGDSPTRTVRWTGQSYASSGGTQTYKIVTIASQAGSATNTVGVTSTEAPPVSASASLLVTGPVLTINKTANTTVIVPVGTMDYTVQYANVGTATATGLTFSDALPTGFTLVTGAPTTAGCTQAGSTVTCDLALSHGTSLAAGETRAITLRFSVGATAPNPSTNTVTITSTNAATVSGTFTVTPVSNACATSTYWFRNTTGAVDPGPSYSVGYVNMTQAGTGYTSLPTVTFSGGAGSGAAGNATGVTGAAGIYGANVTDGGSGYTTAPTVTFVGGGATTAAQGTAVLTNNQFLAQTTQGATNTTTAIRSVTTTSLEIMRFYSDPADSTTSYVLGTTASVKTGWRVVSANPKRLQYNVRLAMYDPATEAMIDVVSGGELLTGGISTGDTAAQDFTRTLALTVPAGTVLRAGWRLVWIISANDPGAGGATTTLRFLYNGTANYESYGTVCMTPLRTSLTKRADKLTINPGVDTLTYTIEYANTSTAAVREAVISDPLPAGMTFLSASNFATTTVASATVTAGGSGYSQSAPPTVTISGGGGTGATARAIVIGGAVTAVEILTSGSGYTTTPTIAIAAPTSGTTATATAVMSGTVAPAFGTNGTITWRLGTLAAGATGSVTVTVATSAAMTGTSVTNTATLSHVFGPSVTASAITTLARPNVLISKRTSANNLVPGQAFQYTIDIVNAGTGLATGVVMSDPLPSYITSTGFTAPTTAVASASIVAGGSGYTTPPTVTISGGGGSGATGVAVLSATGAVSAVVITNPGTGYTSAPTVGFSGGGGSGASANTTLRSVTGVPGGSASTVTFNVGAMPAGATVTLVVNTAVATAGVAAGQHTLVNTASVTDSYDPTPRTSSATVVVTAAPQLTLAMTATPSANRVIFVDVVTPGSGFTSRPTVTIAAPPCAINGTTCVQATAVASINAAGELTGISITNPGNGYTAAPVVTVTGGGGSGFTVTPSVGPGPGDRVVYVVTVGNIGNADATDVMVYGTIPANTSYFTGGTFNGVFASTSLGTVAPGASGSLTYEVTISSALPYSYSSPFAITTLSATGSTSSTNAAAPAPLTRTTPTGAEPRYTISKLPDGGTIPFPAATLTSAATGSNSIAVNSVSQLGLGDYVVVAGTVVRVTAISGTTVTLSGNVTAGAGAGVFPAERYSISYANAGNAAGANVTITDTLPAGLLYAGVPAGEAAPFSAPAIGATGTIVWNVGTLTNGASGAVEFLAYASAAGIYTNSATIADGTGRNTRNATDTAQTTFGALNPTKATTTPQVTNGAPNNIAHYVITVQNPLASQAATSVVITDDLQSGFTYVPASTKVNGTAVADASVGSPAGGVPVWSGALLDIPASGTLTLEFDAAVASSVANGNYDNEITVTSTIPSLTFDYLATTAENVQVCNSAPPINAPAVCAGSTGNVASTEYRPGATYSWSITNGTITTFSTGTIYRVALGSAGSGYTVGNVVTFVGGGGSGATGIVSAVNGSGGITAITVTNPGSGYTSVPTVSIAGGAGATTAAVLGTGIIYTAGSAGTVDLQVTLAEGGCSVTSTQSATANATPVVTTDIASRTACPGTTLTFSPTVSGATTFQWQVSTNSGATWANLANSAGGCTDSCVSGATTSSLTITNVQSGVNGFVYRLATSNASGCSATTSAATVNVTCALDLEVTTNSDSPDPVYAGGTITYTQLITNLSTSNAATQPITFTQPLPAGTTFVSMTPPNANWSCAYNSGTGVITCSQIASPGLAATANTGNFTLVVTVPATASHGTVITDTATVSVTAPDTDAVASNNSKTTTTTVNRLVDLQVIKDDTAVNSGYGPHLLYPGNPPTPQAMDWIVTLSNAGPTAATNVVITDDMPAGFTYSGVYATSNFGGGTCSFSSPTITCTTLSMPVTAMVTLSGGGGSGAFATATVSGGAITAINVVHRGSGYTSAPAVTINGGTGAAAVATVINGEVTGITVNAGGSGYTAPARLTFSGTVTATQTQITNEAVAAADETDSNLANNRGVDTVGVLAPTFVKMLSMSASQAKKSVTVTWQTSLESNNLGFNVYREALGGQKEKLNGNIITGSAFFDGTTQEETLRSYRFVDRKAHQTPYAQYWIEDVDLDGTRSMHGPIAPKATGEDDAAASSPTDPDRTLGSIGGIFTTDAGMGVTAPAATSTDAARQAQQWQLSATPNGKVVVTRQGWYRVRKSDLAAAGYDPGSNPKQLALFTDGIEVPIVVNDGGDNSFDANDTIEFFGRGIDTPSTGGRIYYVNTVKGSKARVRKANGGGRGAASASSYPYTFERVERTVFFTALVNNGDRENFFGAIVTTWPVDNFVTVSHLDPSATTAKLEVVLQGATDPHPHVVAVSVNGRELGPVRFKDMERRVATLDVPASWLTAGENKITFQAVAGDSDVSVVESVRLTYPHLYRAESNALMLTASGSTTVDVSGFTTKNVRAFDLTNPAEPVLLETTVAAANDGTFTASLLTENGASRTVFVVGDDRVLPPAQVVYNEPSTWNATNNAADLVILTNRAFLTAANSLKTARAAQGIRTTVVDVQNVYDEFSYGAHSPQAIRDFLQRTRSWSVAPKYAILLGDASFDARDYLGMGSFDFVPTKLVPTLYMKTASDDWFADFDNSGIPAIAIGRIPARTAGEAEAMIGKLVRRGLTPAAGTWSNTVSVINDEPNGVPFAVGASQLASTVPSSLTVERIDFAAGNATQKVMESFNSGRLLTEYLGHGSTEIWGWSVFTSTAARELTNGDKLPLVVTMNCLNGYFHDLWTESLAEALLKNANGGAIGAWASSALTSPDQQLLVARELNRQLFAGASVTVGEAMIAAKKATKDNDVRRSWIYFGDPTIRLK